MSPEGNLELLRKFVEAFNRLDVDMVVADLDPDVELCDGPPGRARGPITGPRASGRLSTCGSRSGSG